MHLFLIGQGKLLYFLTRQMTSQGHRLTLICNDKEEATMLSHQFKAVVLNGDGSNPNFLAEAQLDQADMFLALTPQDEDNLVACQIAKRQHGVEFTLALVNDPDNQSLFESLGVSTAVSATEIISNLIQQQTQFQTLQTITPVAEGALNLLEVILEQDSPIIGQRVADLPLTPAAQLVGVQRQTVLLPDIPTTHLQARDRIIVITPASDTGTCLRALVGETR